MNPLAWLILLLALSTLRTKAEGELRYVNTAGVGRESFIYRCPHVIGVPPVKLTGTEAYAQLWFAPASNATEDRLQPVPGSLTTFRSNNAAGLIVGVSRLLIPGTLGGDRITLQLRVWLNLGLTVTNWETALQTTGTEPQKSNLIPSYTLAGLGPNSVPYLGDGPLGPYLTSFDCVPVIPPTDSDHDGLTDEQEQGAKRYSIVPGAFTWEEARLNAIARGGHLATVVTAQEWTDLRNVLGAGLRGKNLWLGGTDAGTEGNWRWITGERWQYDHWRQNEPGNDSLGNGQGVPENYLMIWGNETDAVDNQQLFWNDATVTGGLLARDGYLLELGYWSDSNDPDTDDDGLSDGEEFAKLTNPNHSDSDGDGLQDGDEVKFYLTNPLRLDTDGDLLSDFDEIRQWRSNPNVVDTDADGLSDGDEVLVYRTNPLSKDSDGDGYADALELAQGTDPTSNLSIPGARTQISKALEIEVDTKVGENYQVQLKEVGGNWTNYGTRFAGNGQTQTFLISLKSSVRPEWRVILVRL